MVTSGQVYMSDLNLITVTQNGGFTRIWLLAKSTFTCITVYSLVWFVLRYAFICYERAHWDDSRLIVSLIILSVRSMQRKTSFLEVNLIILGTSIVVLNIPIEFLFMWLSINCNEFVNDIRQGWFQCNLFAFLLIFCGEHQLCRTTRSTWSAYRKELLLLTVCFVVALLADSVER
jgi:hypothetical protein